MNLKFWKKKELFPCSSDNCLVRAGCTKICEKLIMDEEKLKDTFIEHKCCPDCGSTEFIEGPSGGMSTNVKCSNCGHWFNLSLPLSVERIHINNGRFYS